MRGHEPQQILATPYKPFDPVDSYGPLGQRGWTLQEHVLWVAAQNGDCDAENREKHDHRNKGKIRKQNATRALSIRQDAMENGLVGNF